VALNERDLALDQFQKAGMDSGQYDTYLNEAAEPEDDFDLACDAYGLGDYENAVKLFTLVLTNASLEDDKKRDARWNLAMSYVHLGDQAKAEETFKQGGFNEADYTAAISQAFAPEGPPPSTYDPDEELDNAYDAYGTGNFSGAAEILQRLVDSPEVDSSAKGQLKWSLALCHFNLGNDDQGTRIMAEAGYKDSDYDAEVKRIRAARSAAPR
jgi:tetratricopeptide (TPR) repeat protein